MKNSVSLSADLIIFGESLIAIAICSLMMNIIRIKVLEKERKSFGAISFKIIKLNEVSKIQESSKSSGKAFKAQIKI